MKMSHCYIDKKGGIWYDVTKEKSGSVSDKYNKNKGEENRNEGEPYFVPATKQGRYIGKYRKEVCIA